MDGWAISIFNMLRQPFNHSWTVLPILMFFSLFLIIQSYKTCLLKWSWFPFLNIFITVLKLHCISVYPSMSVFVWLSVSLEPCSRCQHLISAICKWTGAGPEGQSTNWRLGNSTMLHLSVVVRVCSPQRVTESSDFCPVNVPLPFLASVAHMTDFRTDEVAENDEIIQTNQSFSGVFRSNTCLDQVFDLQGSELINKHL